MRFLAPLLSASLFTLLPFGLLAAEEGDDTEALSGREIVERYVERQKTSAEVEMLMMDTIVPGRPTVQRELLALYQAEPDGTRQYLLRILGPQAVEGVSLLAREPAEGEREAFLYLPAQGEVQPLTGEVQFAPFLGSDFTYEDLSRENPLHYTYERERDTYVHGAPCYRVRAEPKPDYADNTAYGHRLLFIEQQTYNVLKIEFYDKRGNHVKTFEAYGYESPRVKGETMRPFRAVMRTHGAETQTSFHIIESQINERVNPALFTPTALKTWTHALTEDLLEYWEAPEPVE